MLQNMLFGNLPKAEDVRAKEKAIANKVNKPKKSKTTTVVGSGQGKGKIFNRIQAIKQNAIKHLVDTGEYELITSPIHFWNYLTKAKENGELAVDTETRGLNPIIDEIVGLCLYTPGLKGAYFPLRHTDLAGNYLPDQMPEDVVKEGLSSLKDVKLIFHNAKFDIRVLRHSLGVYLFPYWDTSLAGNFLNENEPHNLKVLWSKYCVKKVTGQESPEAATFGKLFEDLPFNYVPLDIAYLYGAKDAKMTYELFKFQEQFLDPNLPACERKLLKDAGRLYLEIEMKLIPIIADMEDRGIEIDQVTADKLAAKYGGLLKAAEDTLQNMLKDFDLRSLPLTLRSKFTNPININSTTQLAIIIYDYMKLTSPDSRKPRGTGEEILEHFIHDKSAEQYKAFFEAILDYRENAKLMSTYINKLPAIVNAKTGRLHGEFNQYGAKTGRFSSSNPNLQNIPSKKKDIRKMFRARAGFVLISADYSQQEPRVLAHISGDPGLISAYATGKDLYAWLASVVYGVPYEECKEFLPDGTKNPEGKKRRDSMKSVALGLMYGRGTQSIADQLGISYREAEALVDKFFTQFPKIKETVDYWQEFAKKEGYVQTIWGRKRRLPDLQLPKYEFLNESDNSPADASIAAYYNHLLCGARGRKQVNQIKKDALGKGVKIRDNGMKIADAGRQVLNSIIQGSSADITKKAMLAIGNDTLLKELECYLLLTVHDEVICECPEENALRAGARLAELMIAATTDKMEVKMKVDAEYTRCWYGDDITNELEEKYGKVA